MTCWLFQSTKLPPAVRSIRTFLRWFAARLLEGFDLVKAGMRKLRPQRILENFIIHPDNVKDPDWRLKAKAWLKGEDVNNQGRVRSDNIPPYTRTGCSSDPSRKSICMMR
jgi:hypothetical protein